MRKASVCFVLLVACAPLAASTPPSVLAPLDAELDGAPALGERRVLTLRENASAPVAAGHVTLRAPSGVELDGAGTRALLGDPGAREATWGLRVAKPGLWSIAADLDDGGRWCCVYFVVDERSADWDREASRVVRVDADVAIHARLVTNTTIETTIVVPPVEGALAAQPLMIEAHVLGWRPTERLVTAGDGVTLRGVGDFDPSRCHQATVSLQPHVSFQGADGVERLYLNGPTFSRSFTTGAACGPSKDEGSAPVVLGPPTGPPEGKTAKVPAAAWAALAAFGLAALSGSRRRAR